MTRHKRWINVALDPVERIQQRRVLANRHLELVEALATIPALVAIDAKPASPAHSGCRFEIYGRHRSPPLSRRRRDIVRSVGK